jgi:hypothetical protein
MSQQTKADPLVGATDSLIALTLATGAVVCADQQRMPLRGISEFLKTRVTPVNASLAAACRVAPSQGSVHRERGLLADLRFLSNDAFHRPQASELSMAGGGL